MARSISFWLGGVVAFALCLELLFRLLPVSTATNAGYYTDPMILNYPAGHRWTVSTGWDLRNVQRITANNFGFVAHRNFVRDPNAVALIGDSFVEASMLDAVDRPGTQLERALVSRPIYAMGGPGTALLDYAERIRFAHVNFGVRDFVVLMERSDVKQSLCGSGNINGPCLDPKTLAPRISKIAPPSGVKKLLRHSALAQYLAGQLKLQPAMLWQRLVNAVYKPQVAVNSAATPIKTEPDLDKVTAVFFERVRPYVTGRLVIVIDSDRAALNASEARRDPARDQFIAQARAAGAHVVDAEPLFRSHLLRSPLKLEVGPYDHHMNKIGVGIAMRAAAAQLVMP